MAAVVVAAASETGDAAKKERGLVNDETLTFTGMVKKVLFVCVENSNRSQMSQAFAKMIGGDSVKAYSAGSKPSGRINQKAIVAMKELGYDLKSHRPKSLDQIEEYAPFDAVVT